MRSFGSRFTALSVALGAALSLCSPSARASTSLALAAGAQIRVRPTSGPGGTAVRIRGGGFGQVCPIVDIYFTDAAWTTTKLGTTHVAPDGTLQSTVAIPDGAARGAGTVSADQWWWNPRLWQCLLHGFGGPSAAFTVTERGES